MIFEYGTLETAYLRSRDPRLGEIIAAVGPIEREIDADVFSAVVHHIVGQQISGKAQASVFARLTDLVGKVDAAHVCRFTCEELKSCGMSMRKAMYIYDFAQKVRSGEFSPEALERMDDAAAVKALCALKGIGVWTAEMVLLFCLRRSDVLSFGDYGIRRGMRMLYGKKEITREFFEQCRSRYSPCGSVASLYLWAVSGGAVAGLEDPALEENAR